MRAVRQMKQKHDIEWNDKSSGQTEITDFCLRIVKLNLVYECMCMSASEIIC